jgi:hypothetical protein
MPCGCVDTFLKPGSYRGMEDRDRQSHAMEGKGSRGEKEMDSDTMR